MVSRSRAVALLVSSVTAVGSFLTAPAPATAAPPTTPAPPTTAATFSGTVKLSNCSGSIVRWNDSRTTDKALMLTNGHCYQLMGGDDVFVNVPSVRSVSLLDAAGDSVGSVNTQTLLYSTMHGTDVSLYQLGLTYQQLQSRYHVPALTISPTKPTSPQPISVVSGYWKIVYTCKLSGFAYQLKEDRWTWSQSLRYPGATNCHLIGGTSGSPVLDADNTVIGVNNTGNEDGERCTFDNPCEVDRNGNVTVHKGRNYGQQTYLFYGCLDASNQLQLSLPTCKLAKPAG